MESGLRSGADCDSPVCPGFILVCSVFSASVRQGLPQVVHFITLMTSVVSSKAVWPAKVGSKASLMGLRAGRQGQRDAQIRGAGAGRA